MTITNLHDYSVTCDLCQAPGGTWNGRKCPEDALPEGWVFREELARVTDGDLTIYYDVVLCPGCQKVSADGR